jgi:hypothetical protein
VSRPLEFSAGAVVIAVRQYGEARVLTKTQQVWAHIDGERRAVGEVLLDVYEALGPALDFGIEVEFLPVFHPADFRPMMQPVRKLKIEGLGEK